MCLAKSWGRSEFFGFDLSLDLSLSRKKTLAAQKTSTSLRPSGSQFSSKNLRSRSHGGILRHRRNCLIQINLDRLWLPKGRVVQRRVAGKSLGTQYPALEECFKWPSKRRRPLRTIRGTAFLR